MRTTDKFIVKPFNDEKFINTKVVDGKTMIINTSIENAKDVNRIAVVVSLPIDYDGNVLVGDKIVVQHNVFRTFFDGDGKTRESDFHIKDNLFFVPKDLVYMIIRGEERISVDNFCFIKPIFLEEKWVGKVEQKHIGIVKYSNELLRKQDVYEGDKIAFHTDCEYSFEIDGEILYRMRTNRILAKIE